MSRADKGKEKEKDTEKEGRITPRGESYPDWYQDVIREAAASSV